MIRMILRWFILLLLPSLGLTQSLDGDRICIDPGHGGYESDDRFIAETGFWESESNLEKAKYLRAILESFGATVILTREGNDGDIDDPSLSERDAIANENEVDYFNSIHSNGYNGTHNSTLMLFRGYDDEPEEPNAKLMGSIMAVEIFNAHRTTHWSNRGDWSFRPEWGTQGYGVLRYLEMPGTISEGSHHDYIPESWRLMNSHYRKHEAWAIARSFLTYFNAGTFTFGEIAGIVRDAEKTVDHFYISGTDDANLPVNGVTVTAQPGNHVYHGDGFNNGFFLLDSLAPGNYRVYFEAAGYYRDTVDVTVVANQTAFIDPYLIPNAPAVPEHIKIEWDGANSLKLTFDPGIRATDYTIYWSKDGETFIDSVRTASTETVVDGLEQDTVYYFKIRSFNDSLASPLSKRLYAAVPSSEPHSVLIVNGFDRSTNTRHDYIRFYADPVNKRGYPFSYVMNETVSAGKINLNNFNTVIWILGDESTADHTFDLTEQDKVESFLDNGGHFFVSGSEIAWDLGEKGSIADAGFHRHYLKGRYVADAPLESRYTYHTATNIDEGFFAGIGDIWFDDGSHGTIDVDYPDAIWGEGGAVNILQYKNVEPVISNGVAGFAYEGLFPNGILPGKLVYFGFPFETIYPESMRIAVMSRIFDFFEGLISHQPAEKTVIAGVEKFYLYQNYPNPFNPLTQIKFSLREANYTNLTIYDILGRQVSALVNEKLAPGVYTIDFNAGKLASGTYFYILNSGPEVMKKKMVLLK